MKLKTRLVLSFLIIIIVPILLTVSAIAAYVAIQKSADDSYSIEGSYATLTNSLRLLSQYADSEFSDVERWIKTDSTRALDADALRKFNAKVQQNGASFLIVREGEDIIFNGSGDGEYIAPSQLPQYGANRSVTNVVIYISGAQPALLRQIDFRSPDETMCTAFMVTTSRSILPETRRMAVNLFLSFVLILILTAVILISWTYQGLVPRIRKLVHAADEIRDGNLSVPVETGGHDEISELCRAFEDMRRRLEATQKEKLHNEEEQRQLLSNIAHDLKTPITAVKGYAEGLLDGVASTPEKQQEYLKTIVNKSNEMNSLINELTFYTRIDTNRIPYNFQHLSVRDYFLDCSEEIGMDLAAQQVEFSYYNYCPDGTEFIADPEQLERVIHNIVGNSVKYRGSDPLIINLRVRDVGTYIQVEIGDNGKGIAAKDLPYIFERTFRADASRNSSVGGSGIGLSIAKKIIEDHGGSIWATSEEGRGTVMYFVLRKYTEEQNGGTDTDH